MSVHDSRCPAFPDQLGPDRTPIVSALLDLFGAPAGVRIPHVGGRLNRRDELERNVTDSDQADERAGDVVLPARGHDRGSDEDVNCQTSLLDNPENPSV